MGERSDLDCLQNADTFKERSKALSPDAKVPALDVGHPKAREKPLLFVDFGNVEDRKKHPPPDPLLLLAKAAAIWEMMNDTTILTKWGYSG